MAKVIKNKKQAKRQLQRDGYWFTQAEASSLVRRAKEIGFTPEPHLIREKKFDKSKVQDSITFKHTKTDETITIHKYDIKLNGLDLMKSSIVDIFFTILFEEIKATNYMVNYEP